METNPPNGKDIINADFPIFVEAKTYKGRIAQWAKWRSEEPGITNNEIAQRLGILPHSLNTLITKAKKEGWLVFEDPMLRLEHEIIPKTIDNLNHFLDAKDKQVTIETAKGTIFKQFQEAKGISDAPKTILALKFEKPEGLEPVVVTGTIVGKPRKIEIDD